jgi:hypothetical protein
VADVAQARRLVEAARDHLAQQVEAKKPEA